MKRRALLLASVVLAGLVAVLALPALARADIGIQGPAYAPGTGGSPTTAKPESKLWFTDGSWWAVMAAKLSDTDNSYHIFQLQAGSWVDTGTPVDGRDSSRQDVLLDGNTLWVASHKFQEVTAFSQTLESAPDPRVDGMRLYRFTYNPGTDTYTPDPGFPVTIDPQRSEALVIDEASDGKIWATWVQQNGAGGAHRVFTSHTGGNCASALDGSLPACDFTPRDPFGSAVSSDDISSLIRFGGNIGIMWSDQLANAMNFVVVGPPDTFGSIETAISGPKQADDHINLKTDGTSVYVATKTKFISKTALNPQTRLLVRDGSGTWTPYTISYSPDQRTRPVVVLDTVNDVIHVFETGPHPSGTDTELGGSIYESTSDLNSINFAVLSRRPVIEDSDSPGMNNVTSTKQNVGGSIGDLVALASNRLTRRYWHHFETLSAPPPPPPPGLCTITGTSGPDIINGTSGADVICGLGGNDIIRGFRGADLLIGGGGADVLLGGGGPDRLAGAGGRDRLVGGRAKDVFHGGRGKDTLFARDRRRELVDGDAGRDRARVDPRDIRRSIEVLF